MVGSVLAAVGTALPETMIPIIAIIFVGTEAAEEVGIGAILGAPFMLSTAAMFVTGVAVLAFARGGRRKPYLSIDQRIVGRDLRFFLGMYIVAIGLGLPFFEMPFWLRVVAGVVARRRLRPLRLADRQDPRRARGPRGAETPATSSRTSPRHPRGRVVAAALRVAGGASSAARSSSSTRSSRLSELFGISPLVLSLIIAPLATELPEKFNSVLWVRQRKDTLAMGNISGAMVFQSCIPVTVGLWFTPWVLTEAAIASAVIAIGAGLLLQVFLRTGNVLTGRELTSLGIFYAAFIVYIVCFY